MKKLFILLLIGSIWACNQGGSGEELPPEDINSPSVTAWIGRVMADSSNWVSMARYNPTSHPGYDTVLAYVRNGYTGELPAVDDGAGSYLVDSAGNVVSKGYKMAQVAPMGGGIVSINLYNSSTHEGYSEVYFIHVNK